MTPITDPSGSCDLPGDLVLDGPASEPGRQPYLHELVTCLAAPAVWMSPVDGQVAGGGSGLFVADRRLLSRLEVRVGGIAPTPVSGGLVNAAEARFVGVARGLGDVSPDPTVLCERRRQVRRDGGVETVVVHNRARQPVRTRVEIDCGTDLIGMEAVKSGRHGPLRAPTATRHGLQWQEGPLTVALHASPDPARPAEGRLAWDVVLEPNERWSAVLTVQAVWTPVDEPAPDGRPGFRPWPPPGPPPWDPRPLGVRADDRRFDEWVGHSLDDLAALLLADPADPDDRYVAAGSPWFLTLFGRDALWAARLALPLGPELAGGTLRTLARRQGRRVDPATEEAPGKIPHELRTADSASWHPPVYYGTVDATPLFVATLVEAWRWGLPEREVAALLPAAERALAWLRADGDPDGDGFVEYVAHSAHGGPGLANQGWKDSGDGVQWADGRLAEAPIALCEVQAYAHQAAVGGAALLDAFGRPGGDEWRDWAARLADRFRAAYWVADADGPYPAVALDSAKRPVDGPTSNMGHLLGTGLLRPDEEALVAARLTAPSMNSGFGLRTLADTARGFNPLSYHAGSVWPHDTAIAVWGLARAGFGQQAGELLGGLLGAAAHFGYRLPELYSGERHPTVPSPSRWRPLPPDSYPAACRPQAWTAAIGPLAASLLLGLDPDAPTGTVTLDPLRPSPVGGCQVSNVRVAGGLLSARVDGDGRVHVDEAPPGVRIVTAG